MKLQTPQELKTCPIDFGVKKVKVKMYWLLKMVIGTQFLSLYTYNRETSHTDSPWVENMPVWLRGKKNLESFDWLS